LAYWDRVHIDNHLLFHARTVSTIAE